MNSTAKISKPTTGLTREYGVEKFRRRSEAVVKNLIPGIEGEEYYLPINDQLYKLNLGYRMIKCILEEKYPDSFEEKFKNIKQNTYKYLGNIDISKASTTENHSELVQNIERIKYCSDEILKLLLREANVHLSEELTKEMLEELFSEESANDICGENNNGKSIADTHPIAENESIGRSRQRKIELLDEECLEKFFSGEVDASGKLSKIAAKQLNKLKLAYGLVKWKFQGIQRQSGERYFEHLREVAYIIIREGESPNFEQVLIAMLHDIMEDTNVSFNTLKILFGKKVAFSVHLLSKKSPLHYTEGQQNTDIRDELKESGILNNNLNINDRLASKLRKVTSVLTSSSFFNHQEKEKLCENGITQREIFHIEGFNFLKRFYKTNRRDDYFPHYRNIEKLREKALKEANSLSLAFSEDEIEEIITNVKQVKLADRLHNIRTLKENVKGKIQETLENFGDICREDTGIGPLILNEIGNIYLSDD